MSGGRNFMHAAATPTWQQREAKQSLVAWSISLFIHLALVAILVAAQWSVGSDPMPGGSEVSIITDARDALDASGEVITPLRPELDLAEPVNLTGEVRLRPLPALDPSPDAAGVEPLIGLDAGADLAGATDGGEWAQLAVEGAAAHGAAEFFGLRATGGRFVFVIDKSGSMRGQRMDAAKEELFRSVLRLGEKVEFLVIFYDQQYVTMPVRNLVAATRANKRDALAWVGSIQPEGGTRPLEAMQFALALEPDAVWLLSDGEFDESYAVDIQRANAHGQAVIHTIAFHSLGGEAVLRRIARENRGEFRFIAPP